MFEFVENTVNLDTMQRVTVATWTVKVISDNAILIQKITPDYKAGDTIKKTVKVVDDPEHAYKLMKTMIKADGGATGLIKFMEQHKDFANVWVKNILNHAWDNMKEYRC